MTEIKTVMIDSRLFELGDQNIRRRLLTECRRLDVELYLQTIKCIGEIHSKDLISILGFGVAMSAVVVSILNLLKISHDRWTYEKLVAEVNSYLKLYGVEDHSLLGVSNFENLLSRNGQPAVVRIAWRDKTAELHVGIHGEIAVFAAQPYEPREF